MSNSREAAAYAAVFHSSDVEVRPDTLEPTLAAGQRLWEDVPEVRLYGQWPTHELRTARHRLGRAAFFGTCLANENAIADKLDRALVTNRPEMLAELPGDHTALLVRTDSLTVISDPLGQPPAYYHTTPGRQTIVSSQPSLAKLSEPLRPDVNCIAAQLLIPGAGSTLLGRHSSFHGIGKLAGGEMLRADREGFQVRQYEQLSPDPSVSLQDTVVAVREAMTAGMTARIGLGLPVSADLSGGMDSSSLAFLARSLLGEEPLPVFFSQHTAIDTGDLHYMERYLGLGKSFDLNRFVVDEALSSFTYEDYLETPRPEDLALAFHTSTPAWRFHEAYLKFVGTQGSRLHLTGDGGDEVMGVNAKYLANLAHLPTIGRFWREGLAAARLHTTSPVKLLLARMRLARTDPARSLGEIADRLEGRSDRSWRSLNQNSVWKVMGRSAAWLTPRARTELAEYLRECAEHLSLPEGSGVADYLALNGARNAAQYAAMLKYGARTGRSGVSVQTPFLDRDVIRAAFSLPLHHRGSPYEGKLLLRQALAGLVPDEVFERRSKGAYDEAVMRSVILSRPAIRQILDNSYLADLGLIEPSLVRDELERADTMPMNALWSLESVLSVEGWLHQLDTANKVAPPQPLYDRNTITIPGPKASTEKGSQEAYPISGKQLHVPGHVHAIASNTGALILYNRRTSRYHPLDRTRSNILRALTEAEEYTAAVDSLARRYPNVARSLLESDTSRCLREMQELGVLHADTHASPRRLPKKSGPIRLTATEWNIARDSSKVSMRARDRALTAGTFIIGQVLERLAPHTKLVLLRRLQGFAKRTASYEEAHRLLVSAHSVPSLGRVACAEAPYSAALAAALQRKHVDWHIGASFAPRTFHAWIEAENRPVRAPLEGQVSGSFQSFFEDNNTA